MLKYGPTCTRMSAEIKAQMHVICTSMGVSSVGRDTLINRAWMLSHRQINKQEPTYQLPDADGKKKKSYLEPDGSFHRSA